MAQVSMLSDEWLSRYGLIKKTTACVTRTRTTGMTTITLYVLRAVELKILLEMLKRLACNDFITTKINCYLQILASVLFGVLRL